jgi:hypothetical protein
MRDSYEAKVIYFNKNKEFDFDGDGNLTHDLSLAYFYREDFSDEALLKDLDDDYKEQAEIWKVRVTIETI